MMKCRLRDKFLFTMVLSVRQRYAYDEVSALGQIFVYIVLSVRKRGCYDEVAAPGQMFVYDGIICKKERWL